MKRIKIVFYFFALLIFLDTPVCAAQWVQSGEDWYYIDENGYKLRNTVSEEGYWIDCYGKYVPIRRTTTVKDSDVERSSNFFFKYLETGDAKYLTGSEYITLPEPRTHGILYTGEEDIYADYVNYLSCMDGFIFSSESALAMGYWKVVKIHPPEYLERAQDASTKPQNPFHILDENNVPLYYQYMNLTDRGDFHLLSGARNKGLQIYEVAMPNGDIINCITQRDSYKAYKEFIDMATTGIDNMSERELALHFERVVKDYLRYSYTLYDEDRGNSDKPIYSGRDRSLIGTILANSGMCADYANMYEHLCRIAGLQCTYEDSVQTGIRHRWNLVKVDGVWYHVDVTWADGNSKYDGLMTECHVNGQNCQKPKK